MPPEGPETTDAQRYAFLYDKDHSTTSLRLSGS
jgi:hypothetical protein